MKHTLEPLEDMTSIETLSSQFTTCLIFEKMLESIANKLQFDIIEAMDICGLSFEDEIIRFTISQEGISKSISI